MIVILLIEVGQINDVVLICGIKLVTVDILLLWPYTSTQRYCTGGLTNHLR